MDGLSNAATKLLVVYDGRCGFCNGAVRWLLKRDRHDRLRFVAFESPSITELLEQHGIAGAQVRSNPDTMLVVRDAGGPQERVWTRSDAWAIVLQSLPGTWPAVGRMFGWIPRWLRDLGYRFVARARYLLAGRLESCPLPSPAERARFL